MRFRANDLVIDKFTGVYYRITSHEISNVYGDIYFIEGSTRFFPDDRLLPTSPFNKFKVGDIAFVNRSYDKYESKYRGYMNTTMRTYKTIRITHELSFNPDYNPFQYSGVCIDEGVFRRPVSWNDEMLFTKEEYLEFENVSI